MSLNCDDFEAQRNELDALQSIFEDLFSCYGLSSDFGQDTVGGELKVIVDMPASFLLSIDNSINREPQHHAIAHLPSIFLRFTFPPDYPSCSPPQFTLSCKWLDRMQLTTLCRHLDEVWKEYESEILYNWVICLQNSLSLLGLTESIKISSRKRQRSLFGIDDDHHRNFKRSVSLSINSDKEEGGACCGSLPDSDKAHFSYSRSNSFDSRALQDVGSASNLVCFLLQYNDDMIGKNFDAQSFLCKVCFNEKSGSESLKFWPCSHVYCKLCMKGYFEIQIKEGNITLLRCPEDKCNSDANPKQVESLVSSELFKKWDEQLLSSTLSSLGDIQPCPRAHCQYPVTIEGNQGQCPSCAFVFCSLCRFGAHGVQKCRLKNSEVKNVIEEYMNGSEEIRKRLEKKYSKKYLTGLCDEYLSMNYLNEYAKECPRCRANIEKEDGCNKMTCNRCGSHFCWLCNRVLNIPNPYSHFNNPNDGCFNRLFEGMDEFAQFENEFDSDEDLFD